MLFAGIEFKDDVALFCRLAGANQVGKLEGISTDGRSRERDGAAGAELAGRVDLEIDLAALDFSEWNLIVLCRQGDVAGSHNHADARGQQNANHCPDEDATPFDARHLTPSPKGLQAPPGRPASSHWRPGCGRGFFVRLEWRAPGTRRHSRHRPRSVRI